MKLEIASDKDNKELLEFYQSFILKSWVDLKPDRGQDFFAPYRTQSPEFKTYLLRSDTDSKIHAMASFIMRETLLDGKATKVAYATDLRVSTSRKAILEWPHHFLPILNDLRKQLDVSHFFSVINTTDPTALNTFVRPRNMRRPLPRYYLYRKFFLNTLHGRFPWAPMPLPHLRIRQGSESNVDALVYYILQRSSFRPFSSVWNHESFLHKIKLLPGFKLSDFLVAFDANENVVGCLAPWSPANVHRWIPLHYSLQAHNFRQFLKFGRLLGWTRPLTKPVASTGREAPLNFRYLTHVAADNEDIFESLLWTAYESCSPQEFLVYAQAEADYRLAPPPHWIYARMPHSLYAVISPDRAVPSYLQPNQVLNPEIEAAFV